MLGYKGTGQGSSMHLIAVDVWPVLKVGLSVCRVIDFKQRYVQISLLKLFALIFYTRAGCAHLIAEDFWPVLKAGLSICRVV